MKRRLVATLLVLGIARAAHAADADASNAADAPDAADTEPPPAPPSAPPPPVVVVPVIPPPVLPASLAAASIPTPTVVVVPPPAPGGGGPLVAGVLTAFVPFVVGCALWSSNDGSLEKAGTTVMALGFAAAPWVSHGLQGRWRRAAIFGSISAATAAATLIAMEEKDPFYAPYANRQRVGFGIFLTSALFAAAAGVLDSFLSAPAREAP